MNSTVRERVAWCVLAILGLPLVLWLDPPIASRVLLGAIAVTAGVFVVSYALWSEWLSTHVGRSLMACAATVALISGHATISALLGDYPGKLVIRVVLFYGLLLGIVHMTWSLWRTQRRDEEDAS